MTCSARARDMVSAWASVLATTKSTPWSPALIMLLTALPPAPPTPKTVIRGFNSLMSSFFVLTFTACLFSLRGRGSPGSSCRHLRRNLFRLAQKISPTPYGLDVVLAIGRVGELL